MGKLPTETQVRNILIVNCKNLLTWPSGRAYKLSIQWMIDELSNPDKPLKETLAEIAERHHTAKPTPDNQETQYAQILLRVPVMWTPDSSVEGRGKRND